MNTLRVFLAHPKSLSDERIEGYKVHAQQVIERAVAAHATAPPAVEVVTGRDDFMQNIQAAGGFDGWCQYVGAGRAYRNGALQPTYDLIVVGPEPRFGRATAAIIGHALQSKRPVYFLSDVADALTPVAFLSQIDAMDFRSGWTVQ